MLLLAALCAAAGHLYVVVTTPDASPTEAFAAHELSTLVGNISNGNVPLEVFNLSAVPVGRTMRLYVGYSASVGAGVAETDLAGLGSDGFRVAVHYNHPSLCAGCAAISGGKAARRGALYGAYELLERFGLEFIAWDETTLPPDAPYASLEALMPGADIVQTPSYGYRDLGDWHPYSNRLHARRMRLNNNAFYECVENTANPACKGEQAWDMFHYASPPGMGHSIYRLLCSNGTDGNPRGMCDDPLKPPQDLIKTHPEWFWPHGDADSYGQVCYHNASLQAFIIQQVKDILKHQPDAPWLSITQNDNSGDCMDPEEIAIVNAEGGLPQGRTAPQLRVVNMVADAVREDYPNLLIDTFAYEQTSYPPNVTKPSSNVIIRVATPTCNEAMAINDTSNVNGGTRRMIEQWSAVSSHMSIWDYTANYDNPVIPYPDYFKWGDNFKYLHANKVVGYYGEGSAYEAPGHSGDLPELVIFLQSKLMWDVTRDSDALIDRFLKAYYGPAAPHIFAYMKLMIGSQRTVGECAAVSGDGPEFYPATAAFLTPEAVVSAAIEFARAATAVKDDPTRLFRVRSAELPILYTMLMRWDEMVAYAASAGLTWPLEHTVNDAFVAFSRIANATAKATRCHFVVGTSRCQVPAFGQPKGPWTTGGGPPFIPYLTWVQVQLNGRNGTSSAWCQPGYNQVASPPCWQNCSQPFYCEGRCVSPGLCATSGPPPPKGRQKRKGGAQHGAFQR